MGMGRNVNCLMGMWVKMEMGGNGNSLMGLLWKWELVRNWEWEGQSKSMKMTQFELVPITSYDRPILTVGLSRTISKISRDIGRKMHTFLLSFLFNAPEHGVTLGFD